MLPSPPQSRLTPLRKSRRFESEHNINGGSCRYSRDTVEAIRVYFNTMLSNCCSTRRGRKLHPGRTYRQCWHNGGAQLKHPRRQAQLQMPQLQWKTKRVNTTGRTSTATRGSLPDVNLHQLIKSSTLGGHCGTTCRSRKQKRIASSGQCHIIYSEFVIRTRT